MSDPMSTEDWDLVASKWTQIGDVVMRARDRADARRLLLAELGVDPTRLDAVLDFRVGDLVQFARPIAESVEEGVEPRAAWHARGQQFPPGTFLLEEREPWRQWIRDGVDGGWLNVVRLRQPGALRGLERTNDDRSVFIEHPCDDGATIRVHTAIGGTYPIADGSLSVELAEFLDAGNSDLVEDVMFNGRWSECRVLLEGKAVTGRLVQGSEGWAVSVAVDAQTNAFVTGRGTDVPELDLVIVRSFEQLDSHR